MYGPIAALREDRLEQSLLEGIVMFGGFFLNASSGMRAAKAYAMIEIVALAIANGISAKHKF